jgi:hypothetical protein
MSYDEEAWPRQKRRKPRKLTRWVRERQARDTLLCAVGVVVLIPLTMLVLLYTYGVLYQMCWRVSLAWHPTHEGLVGAAGFLLGMLFVGNYFLGRNLLDNLEFDSGPRGILLGGCFGYVAGPQSTISYCKIFLATLFVGPRMVATAWRLGWQVYQLQLIDVDGCGRVLGTPLAEHRRVPYEELSKLYPKLDIDEVRCGLSRFHGIVFLPSDPPGMALTPDLEEDLIEHIEREREARDGD